MFDKQATPAGYVDRESGVWDIAAASIDLEIDGGELASIMSGGFVVAATRLGCEDAGCEMHLTGIFRACATGYRIVTCE